MYGIAKRYGYLRARIALFVYVTVPFAWHLMRVRIPPLSPK
jgi:hypothetical protein